jgi:tRNA1(Val) A37 N6-methylase TrmN6
MVETGRSPPLETTTDAWLGGKLKLRQPLKGHRVGSDAALLAAATPASEHLVDVGAGVGAVGLALAQRLSRARVALVEIDPALGALARENAQTNGLDARVHVAICDVAVARARRAAGLEDGKADVVVTNPPFFAATTVRASPDGRRARAHVLSADSEDDGGGLARWIVAALALLAPGGRFVMIHRPDALTAILASFGQRLGAIAILPIHPRADAPAHRLLIAGVKGARAPLSIRPALVLHGAIGAFTEEAAALHRGDALIDWAERTT